MCNFEYLINENVVIKFKILNLFFVFPVLKFAFFSSYYYYILLVYFLTSVSIFSTNFKFSFESFQ